ncbi:S-adenosylmethionine carrier 1, chloroplastic/mitochondrial-like isoform X2 [Cucumis melo]|uniref:S-adenosylmethionine carrier 1, chloroplastic/mitochondrial-like isoform X2 n=1 Tax=Cucumis melo TaxID=3656 RepID=A0ABM3KLU2_CUCME|nr:S-adenosylmethionine carrier 1, chloroplastic/mitochondrial-like isoform X2 [Cucumis melo]
MRDSPDVLVHEVKDAKNKVIKLSAALNVGDNEEFDFVRSLYEGAIAGSVASFVIEAALYPIDTIKTRLQAVHGGGKIVLKGLYSGLTGNLVGMLPCSSYIQTAGVVGGVASSIIRVPTEVVKQRMQTSHFASASNAVQAIVSREGFKGLYAGYGSFLLRDLPFDAIQFCIYEQLRIGYKLAAQRDPNDPENALIGAFSGAVTGAITTPFDVIKTRLMVQGSNSQYQGIRDCCRTIMKEEGARAFLKGMGPRVLWIGLGGAIFFGVLEKTKQMLANQRHPLPEKPIQSQ